MPVSGGKTVERGGDTSPAAAAAGTGPRALGNQHGGAEQRADCGGNRVVDVENFAILDNLSDNVI